MSSPETPVRPIRSDERDTVLAIINDAAERFACVSTEEKTRLLRRYWDIPERQVETSVVLARVSCRSASTVAAALPAGRPSGG